MRQLRHDRRVLAEMERTLSRDDPELVALIGVLNEEFADRRGSGSHRWKKEFGGERHDWRLRACALFVVMLVASLVLTLIFSGSPSAADGDRGSPNGRGPFPPLSGATRVLGS